MRDGIFYDSLRDANARPYQGSHQNNSPDCFDMRSVGEITLKEINITAAGATVDLFTFTGAVRVFGISARFTDVTDVVDIDAVSLDLDDGAVQTPLTAVGGVTCDGVTAGAVLLKDQALANALTLLDADQVRVDETDPKRLLYPFILNGLNGGTNKIRMTYTSAGGCDATMVWVCEWRHVGRHSDGLISAA